VEQQLNSRPKRGHRRFVKRKNANWRFASLYTQRVIEQKVSCSLSKFVCQSDLFAHCWREVVATDAVGELTAESGQLFLLLNKTYS